jgi:hypothetical protein
MRNVLGTSSQNGSCGVDVAANKPFPAVLLLVLLLMFGCYFYCTGHIHG